jgi:hypothetical protein
VIVDNEDSLFFLSEATSSGLIQKLLDKRNDHSFKYSGAFWWNPPRQWTATTDEGYYGKYVRSAYVVKGGTGNQTATWKIPVPTPGRYEIYFHNYNPEIRDGGRGGRGGRGNKKSNNMEYHFKIQQKNDVDETWLNVEKAGFGWALLGTYFLASDTAEVILSNDCSLSLVVADAIKIVKKEQQQSPGVDK